MSGSQRKKEGRIKTEANKYSHILINMLLKHYEEKIYLHRLWIYP